MSPYVVTTRKPSGHPEADEGYTLRVSRRAVATLDEARMACVGIVQPYAAEAAKGPARRAVADVCLSLMRKDWSGGTVGPLPDGTVIQVERLGADGPRDG